MINLTFLRHASTDLNGKGYIATKKDFPINSTGIIQCKSNIYPKGIFEHVICSPFLRTKQTAQLVYPYLEPIINNNIIQRDLGILNEKFKTDYEKEYLELVRNYIITPEGAESLRDIINRLDKFFYEDLSKYNNSNILVVTHNGIMRIIKKYYLNEKSDVESKNLEQFQFILK